MASGISSPLPLPTGGYAPDPAPAESQPLPAVLARVVRQSQPVLLDEAEREFVRTTFRAPPLSVRHPARRCSVCGGSLGYVATFDAFCCTSCDVWLEPVCTDAGCRLCHRRPARPSEQAGRRGRPQRR
jgi:hypothetical protein